MHVKFLVTLKLERNEIEILDRGKNMFRTLEIPKET